MRSCPSCGRPLKATSMFFYCDYCMDIQLPLDTPTDEEKAAKAAKNEEQRRKRELEEASKPHCPYCNSTNLDRIGGLERFVSVGTLGLASNKMGKNFKCKNCKATF